jgi:hypothetical protein
MVTIVDETKRLFPLNTTELVRLDNFATNEHLNSTLVRLGYGEPTDSGLG